MLKAYSHLSAKHRGSRSQPNFLTQAETAGKAAESDSVGTWECELFCAAARGIVSEAWLYPLFCEDPGSITVERHSTLLPPRYSPLNV